MFPGDAGEERVVLEVADAVLAEAALARADEPLDQVLGVLRHVADVGGELEALLRTRGRGFVGSSGNRMVLWRVNVSQPFPKTSDGTFRLFFFVERM